MSTFFYRSIDLFVMYIVNTLHIIVLFFFFFFQAEDGIRDHCVTGVQTCALPISSTFSIFSVLRPHFRHLYSYRGTDAPPQALQKMKYSIATEPAATRRRFCTAISLPPALEHSRAC